jgi:hypothetical protein
MQVTYLNEVGDVRVHLDAGTNDRLEALKQAPAVYK